MATKHPKGVMSYPAFLDCCVLVLVVIREVPIFRRQRGFQGTRSNSFVLGVRITMAVLNSKTEINTCGHTFKTTTAFTHENTVKSGSGPPCSCVHPRICKLHQRIRHVIFWV